MCMNYLNKCGALARMEYLVSNTNPNADRIAKLKILAVKLEKKKADILTSFYITGRIDGLYFGRASKSKRNHVKEYIKGCLYKNRIDDMSLIDDCYNTMFLELYKKPASHICAMYDEAPAKLLATALRIIALKCFGRDKRTNTPKHSLITGVLFASIVGGSLPVNRTEEEVDRKQQGCNKADVVKGDEITLSSNEEPEDFVKCYGFSPEDIVNRMTPDEQATFYDILGKQPRGKTPASKVLVREALFERIKQIAEELK